jgi:hypothetical protein
MYFFQAKTPKFCISRVKYSGSWLTLCTYAWNGNKDEVNVKSNLYSFIEDYERDEHAEGNCLKKSESIT